MAIGVLVAAPAFAADLPTKKEAPPPIPEPVIPSTWRFELTAYGWASSIAGSTGFGSLPTLPYYASFGKVLEHFQGAFMGSVVARNDMFIGGIDFVWARIGGSGTLRNPDSVLYGGQTDLTLNEAFVTAFGGVRLPLGVPNLALYGTVGARNFYSGTKLTVTGPFGLFNGTESVNKDWVMPVAGFAAQYRFDDRWFMNVLADLGGWTRQRDRTGARLRRLQLDSEHRDDARLSRHVHVHQSGYRLQLRHPPAQELPLPAVDVRAVRRLQVQLLKQRPREWI